MKNKCAIYVFLGAYVLTTLVAFINLDSLSANSEHISNMVSSITAFFSLIGAIFMFIPEFEKYLAEKKNQREDKKVERNFQIINKKSDVAERISLSLNKFIDSIMFITMPVVLEGEISASDMAAKLGHTSDPKEVQAETRKENITTRVSWV
jgi:hypothetical protein